MTSLCCKPYCMQIKEGEFLQTEERLWMTSDVRPIASHSTCPGVRWRQHQRALKSKQAELQCQVRKLKAVLPGLVEQSRRRIVELKSKVEEVRDAFPDLVSCTDTSAQSTTSGVLEHRTYKCLCGSSCTALTPKRQPRQAARKCTG